MDQTSAPVLSRHAAQQLLHPLIVFFLQLYGFALTADALQAMTWSNDSQDDDQI